MKSTKKFQTISCMMTVLSIAGLAALLILHFHATEKNRITHKAALILDTLEAASIVQIPKGAWKDLRLYSNKIFADDEVHHLSITGTGQVKLVSHFKEKLPATQYLMSFSRDIQTPKMDLGTINLVINAEPSQNRNSTFAIEIIIGALLIAGLLCGLIIYLTNALHSPLDSIIRAMQRANKGDYTTRLAIPENTDFEQLATCFNQLIYHFEAQHNRLKVYADEIADKNIQMSKQISERMSAQAAFHATQVRYQAVFDQTFQHTGLISLEGKILECNSTALELFQYSREDLLGKSFIEEYGKPFEKSDRQSFRINFSKALQGDLVGGTWSVIAHTSDQSFIDYTLKPVLDEEGHVSMILYEAHDITGMKEAEAALLESEMQIRQSQKMEAVGRLAGGIAHDFNNLLTSILGYSDLIQDQLERAHPAREDLKEIIDSAHRARELTQRLLTLSRKRKVKLEPLNLNTLIEELKKIIRVSLDERVTYIKELDDSIPYIQADKVSIEQIIVNLVINASHAMAGKDGRLTIQTHRIAFAEKDDMPEGLSEGDFVLLCISDTGCGMSEEVRERAFEPFFTTKNEGGTGLGLSTVYGIVNQLGGTIILDTAEEAGTTFRIYLPASDAMPLEILEEVPSLESLRGNETLLVVEDSESVRRLTVKIATTLGYNVLTAEDGLEALTVAHNVDYQIDLILSDVIMPNLSGPEFIQELLKRGHDLPHIYMTGFSRDKLSFNEESQDSVTIVQKPFTREYLASRIRERLNARGAKKKASKQKA